MTKNISNTLIVCSECGSDKVMLKNWYNPNTLESFGWDEDDMCYCEKCCKMTRWKEVSEKRRIWVRVGMTIEANADEIEKLISGDCETLVMLVDEGKVATDGESYIPESEIEEYNREYGTDHPIKDVEFEF